MSTDDRLSQKWSLIPSIASNEQCPSITMLAKLAPPHIQVRVRALCQAPYNHDVQGPCVPAMQGLLARVLALCGGQPRSGLSHGYWRWHCGPPPYDAATPGYCYAVVCDISGQGAHPPALWQLGGKAASRSGRCVRHHEGRSTACSPQSASSRRRGGSEYGRQPRCAGSAPRKLDLLEIHRRTVRCHACNKREIKSWGLDNRRITKHLGQDCRVRTVRQKKTNKG